MNKLNYYTHVLLNSKYKIFINIIFYLIILFIYNSILHEYHVTECMKRAVPMPSPESDTDYTQLLENENKQLKEHLETQQSNIEYLEENQKYLMDKISTLQVQITEAHDTMAEIAGSNMDLRSQAAEKQIIFERTLENLEAAKKHCADALSALGRS